jgi:mannose-6-phosphate isomerase-like protein (cupin superfamily)
LPGAHSRRVVTGLDSQGKSCFIIDGEVPHYRENGLALVWRTEGEIADNSGTADTARPYALDLLHAGGSNFTICTFSPGMNEPMMHATDTIDYLVVLSGRVKLVLESGETDLGPGDLVVDRGVVHGWANPWSEPCVAAVVNLPAHPVGAGRTI